MLEINKIKDHRIVHFNSLKNKKVLLMWEFLNGLKMTKFICNNVKMTLLNYFYFFTSSVFDIEIRLLVFQSVNSHIFIDGIINRFKH